MKQDVDIVMLLMENLNMNTDIKYMRIAFEEAKKAYKKNEVPVGCVIVCDDKVIAKAHFSHSPARDLDKLYIEPLWKCISGTPR